MPIRTGLRKQLHSTPERQEEEDGAPVRRPLLEPVEAGPAQPGRPYRDYVGNELDRMFQEMMDDLENLAEFKKIPLPEHPDPQHPLIHYRIDTDSGRPIPDEDALIRGDYVYVLEDGSRITRDEFIRPWRGPGFFPTVNDLMSQGWDACYSLHGKGAGMRLAYYWLTGLSDEPRIIMRLDRFFAPVASSSVRFTPHPPAGAEASATQPVPEPGRQPADRFVSRRRQIPLPDHPEPKHPPIYYSLDPISGQPIPNRDSFIRSGYIRWEDLNPAVQDFVFPWQGRRRPMETDFLMNTCIRAYYTLELNNGEISILIHQIQWFPRISPIFRSPLNIYHFTPEEPDIDSFDSSMHFLPRAPVGVEASATQPVPEPGRQPAGHAGSQRREIPLPDHPEPKHPPIYYRLDPVSGQPIPERDSFIRSGYIHWKNHLHIATDVIPWRVSRWPVRTDFLMNTCIRAYYTLELKNGEISILIHDISWFPRIRRIFRSPLNIYRFTPEETDVDSSDSLMHFSPRPPARAEASARQPIPEPGRQPAGRAGNPPVRAEASARQPVPEPGRQPAGRAGKPPERAEASATQPVLEPGRQPVGRAGKPPVRAEASARQPVPEPGRQPAGRASNPQVQAEASAPRQVLYPVRRSARRFVSRRREIPLPDHPAPKHPPIYYRLDPVSGQPIPNSDSFIRPGYIRWEDLNPAVSWVMPWQGTRWPMATDFGMITHSRYYYTLELSHGEISIFLHHIPWFPRRMSIIVSPLNRYRFTPEEPDVDI